MSIMLMERLRRETWATRTTQSCKSDYSFFYRFTKRNGGVEALPEARVQVSQTRFRVPDVCVVRTGDADEPIITAAPLVCLEVLSPDDSFAAMRRRAQDYFDMGVPEVWIFNSRTRTVYACTASSVTEHMTGMLRLAGTEVEISIEEAFKPLRQKS